MEANKAGDGVTAAARGLNGGTYPKVVGGVYTAACRDEAHAPRTESLVRRSRSRPPSPARARGRCGGRCGVPLRDAGFGGEGRGRRADSTG